MKKVGRVVLNFRKRMVNGKIERLRIVVSEKEETAAKAKYKSMGYDAV